MTTSKWWRGKNLGLERMACLKVSYVQIKVRQRYFERAVESAAALQLVKLDINTLAPKKRAEC